MRNQLAFIAALLLLPVVAGAPHPDFPGFAVPIDTSSLVGGSLTVDDDAVYERVWFSEDGGSWEPLNLSGPAWFEGGVWLRDGSASLPSFSDGVGYVVVYSCSYDGVWDCHGGWQLHVVNSSGCGSLVCDDGDVSTLDSCVDGVCLNDPWQPVAQPNLSVELADAPLLNLTESLGGPDAVKNGRPRFVPNPDGSWDAIIIYYESYMTRKEAVIHDFGTGETVIQPLSQNVYDHRREIVDMLNDTRYMFHLVPHYWAAGKLFIDVSSNYRLAVLAYDPVENAFVHLSYPFGYADASEYRESFMGLGDDGMLYGLGWPADASSFAAYRVDPVTYEIVMYPGFGPANPNRRGIYGEFVIDGEWLYAGVGQSPWHLVAFNTRTEEGRLLATTEPLQEDLVDLVALKGGARGSLEHVVSVEGVSDFNATRFEFWLDNGMIYPREGDIPPWSDEPAELKEEGFSWDRQTGCSAGTNHWGDFVPSTEPPEIDLDSLVPDPWGRVELRYRPRGSDEEWSTLRYTVERYPQVNRHMTEVNDTHIYATAAGYGQHLLYDLQEEVLVDKVDVLGLSPRSIASFGDKVYVSGYASSRVYEADIGRPFGVDNPSLLAVIGGEDGSDTHSPVAGTFVGADGWIYNGGITYNREREGGGFGWYDPATGSVGGIFDPEFTPDRIFWGCGSDANRYLLFSTKHSADPDIDGKISCWDTSTHEIVYEVSSPGAQTPGPLAEVFPGLVIGHTRGVADAESGQLYGLVAARGEVLWRKEVPEPPITGFREIDNHRYSFRTGPDGRVWAFFGDVLVRIDPDDAEVHVVGRLPPGYGPAQLAFAGGGVYMAGAHNLIRLEGVSP